MRDVGTLFGRHDRHRHEGPRGPHGPHRLWHGHGSGDEEGFEGFGGRDGARRGRVERGAMRYVILDSLRDGPKHGYEIIKWLDERTGGAYAPSPGAVYPTLQLLADLGLVRAGQDADRRVHELTETGREALAEHADVIQHFWSRFGGAEPGRDRPEIGFVRDEMRELTRTVWGGAQAAMRRGDDTTLREVRAAVERCKNEVRDLIARGATVPAAANETGYNSPDEGV